jgi:GT2 family glycosyltransferase
VRNSPQVTAVIPVHNRLDLLARLLATIAAQSVSFAGILLVDNATDGGIPGTLLGADCRVIEMGENAGFARAVNRGWQTAVSPWVAILNTDVELDSRWLEELLQHTESAGFATGTILSASDPGRIDGTYDLVSRSGCAWRAGHGELVPCASSPRPISIAPATACLFRREVLVRLEGFDESYGSYLEDVELGLRCVENGISGVYVPGAIAWHVGSATFGRWNPRVVRLTARNQLLLVSQHYDRALFRSSLRHIVVGQILWGLVAARHGAGMAWLAGKREGLKNFHPRGKASRALAGFLESSEEEIRTRAPGTFWRWYFRLTGTAEKSGGTGSA